MHLSIYMLDFSLVKVSFKSTVIICASPSYILLKTYGGMKMTERSIYRDISQRTNGDIYIGVVGPVRTGKVHLSKSLWILLLFLI